MKKALKIILITIIVIIIIFILIIMGNGFGLGKGIGFENNNGNSSSSETENIETAADNTVRIEVNDTAISVNSQNMDNIEDLREYLLSNHTNIQNSHHKMNRIIAV